MEDGTLTKDSRVQLLHLHLPVARTKQKYVTSRDS